MTRYQRIATLDRTRKRPAVLTMLVCVAVALTVWWCNSCLSTSGATTVQRALSHAANHVSDLHEMDTGDCTWHLHDPFHQQWSEFEGEEEAETLRTDHISGQCPVCGATHTNFTLWSANYRETGVCSVCGSTNRGRQMAVSIAKAATRALQRPIKTVSDLPRHLPGFTILNTECRGALHAALQVRSGYVCSEYLGQGLAPGEVVNGTRHEDLMDTSFATGSFDLVLSTEVFEHIPYPYKAHSELYRILKPGGVHVFTVPFLPSEYADMVKATLDQKGGIVHLGEPMYHGDPIRKEGILVYTIFGQQMVDRLCGIGYRVDTLHLRLPAYAILGGNGYVFMASKRLSATET